MDINEIIRIADKAYDKDEVVLGYWNPLSRQVRNKPLNGEGDTLARFVCVEIAETYDEDFSDKEQLEIAGKAMKKASEQLKKVMLALWKKYNDTKN